MTTTAAVENEYEAERLRRIAENRKRMEELGIHTAVAALNDAAEQARPAPQPRKRRERAAPVVPPGSERRSGRLRGTTTVLDEDEMFRALGIGRLDMLPMRRRRAPIDPETLARLREERESAGVGRSGLDSGLGVRLQGGRVYDSKLGVTCHWCRQKTLEEHVECTAEGCGKGSRLPTAFCRMCLRNRHGEDVDQAIASGCWVCPGCRGSCGPGCTMCCNCGPCRKKAGLGPTHQLIKQARIHGFDNVHDYLVHRTTGETPEEITDRKLAHDWGRFMQADTDEEGGEGEGEGEGAGEGEDAAATPSAAETLTTGSESEGEEAEEAEKAAAVEPAAKRLRSRIPPTTCPSRTPTPGSCACWPAPFAAPRGSTTRPRPSPPRSPAPAGGCRPSQAAQELINKQNGRPKRMKSKMDLTAPHLFAVALGSRPGAPPVTLTVAKS